MNDSTGKLILRIALGGLILLHGIAKLKGGVYVGEVLAPLMVLVGWYSRIGAALIAVNMVFAIALVHRGELFSLSNSGGWALELQGMYLLTAVAIALFGPGRYSVNGK